MIKRGGAHSHARCIKFSAACCSWDFRKGYLWYALKRQLHQVRGLQSGAACASMDPIGKYIITGKQGQGGIKTFLWPPKPKGAKIAADHARSGRFAQLCVGNLYAWRNVLARIEVPAATCVRAFRAVQLAHQREWSLKPRGAKTVVHHVRFHPFAKDHIFYNSEHAYARVWNFQT